MYSILTLFRVCCQAKHMDANNAWTHDYEWCFRPRFCTCKALLGRGQPGLMRLDISKVSKAGIWEWIRNKKE